MTQARAKDIMDALKVPWDPVRLAFIGPIRPTRRTRREPLEHIRSTIEEAVAVLDPGLRFNYKLLPPDSHSYEWVLTGEIVPRLKE